MTDPQIARAVYPNSNEAELGILCSFLLAPATVGAMCAERRIECLHFHNPIHRTVYAHVTDMWEAGDAIDFITLGQRMRDYGDLEGCGGIGFVNDLFTHLPTAANAPAYLETVEDKRILRGVIQTCEDYAARGRMAGAEPRALLDGLGAQITGIAAPAANRVMTLKQALHDKLTRMTDGDPATDEIPTGLSALDMKSPMRLGDMPLISGERKCGKSILALTIARNVALATGPVLYFSLEDPIKKVTDRLVAAEASIPMAKDTMMSLSEFEIIRLQRAVTTLKGAPLVVRDDCYDLSAIVAVARQQKALTPDLKLIVVDYGQLVRAAVAKGANREQETAAASRGLRLLSMELGVAIIVLVQLNKDGDTRESKSWEQDCTAMWKLVTPPDNDDERNSTRILTIPFQRNGESGIGLKVAFLGHIARIENCAACEPK